MTKPDSDAPPLDRKDRRNRRRPVPERITTEKERSAPNVWIEGEDGTRHRLPPERYREKAHEYGVFRRRLEAALQDGRWEFVRDAHPLRHDGSTFWNGNAHEFLQNILVARGRPRYEGQSDHPARALANRADPAAQAVELLEELEKFCRELDGILRAPDPDRLEILQVVASARDLGFRLGELEARLELQDPALLGRTISEAGTRGGRVTAPKLRKGSLSDEKRVETLADALAPHLNERGRPKRGVLKGIVADVAPSFDMSPEGVRRFYNGNKMAILAAALIKARKAGCSSPSR